MTGSEFLQAWMRSPHTLLDNASPLDLLKKGQAARIAQLIEETRPAEDELGPHEFATRVIPKYLLKMALNHLNPDWNEDQGHPHVPGLKELFDELCLVLNNEHPHQPLAADEPNKP